MHKERSAQRKLHPPPRQWSRESVFFPHQCHNTTLFQDRHTVQQAFSTALVLPFQPHRRLYFQMETGAPRLRTHPRHPQHRAVFHTPAGPHRRVGGVIAMAVEGLVEVGSARNGGGTELRSPISEAEVPLPLPGPLPGLALLGDNDMASCWTGSLWCPQAQQGQPHNKGSGKGPTTAGEGQVCERDRVGRDPCLWVLHSSTTSSTGAEPPPGPHPPQHLPPVGPGPALTMCATWASG